MDIVKVCVLRVDNEGKQYKGYITDLSDELYAELGIDKNYMESVAVTEVLSVVCNKEGAVRGYQLNRALYDAEYNLITVFGGNMIVMKMVSGGVVNINSEDMILIEERLRGVVAISYGFVFTKDGSELPDWE